jgi:hypothetical protein
MKTSLNHHRESELLKKCLKYIEIMEALKKKKREIGYALIQPEMETDPLFKYDCERLAEKVENEYNAINRLYLNTVKEVNRIHNELKKSELPLFRISLN